MIFIMISRTGKIILNMPSYPFEGILTEDGHILSSFTLNKTHEMCALEHKSLTLTTRIWESGESHLQIVSLYILWTWLYL
jgi:hypothetical protein